jgi:hypothetical protein
VKIFQVISIISIALFSSFQTYSQSPAKESKKKFSDIVGAWQIREVTNAEGKDISANSSHIKWIEFTREGRYRSQMGSAMDSGSYRVNENHALLYLQSDTNKNKTAQWKMTFGESMMTLTAKDNPGAGEFKYVYVRTRVKDPKSLRK